MVMTQVHSPPWAKKKLVSMSQHCVVITDAKRCKLSIKCIKCKTKQIQNGSSVRIHMRLTAETFKTHIHT